MLLFADTRTGSSSLLFLIRKVYDGVRRLRGEITCSEKHEEIPFNSIKTSTVDDRLIECIGEPWHSGVVHHFFGQTLYNKLYEGKIEKHWETLHNESWDIIRDVHTNLYQLSYGGKHIWSHLPPAINFALLHKSISEGHSIIFLDRRNIGIKSLSHMLAEQTKQWGWYKEEPVFEDIDFERLDFLIDRYRTTKRDYVNFLESYKNVYYLTYEDLYTLESYNDKLDVIYDLLDFLGVDDKSVLDSTNVIKGCKRALGSSRKQNTYDRLRAIPNISDVSKFIKNKCNGEVILPEFDL